MWHDNKFTKALHIHYPIIQAGMAGGTTTPELVAAVSNTGGLGTLGAGYMSADQMKKAIKKIKALTDKPFGVNLFIPETPQISGYKMKKANDLLRSYREKLRLEEPEVSKPSDQIYEQQLEVIIQEKVPVCSFYIWGSLSRSGSAIKTGKHCCDRYSDHS